MTALPHIIDQAWKDHEGPIVLTTVDATGTPNAIYATCVRKTGQDTWVIADNFFNKTRANILSGSKGALLFITKEGKSYQIKGRIEYHTEGQVFDHMKQWNPSKLPGHAAAALQVEQVFSGGEQIV
jgi:predicted pyridoxine 5'-phosphate oxidase superfamily flavin-nucleotide-binding protein